MPYRDYELPTGDIVKTRISDESTIEWFVHWVNIGGGQSGRPPDVDTDMHRLWLGRRGEKVNALQAAEGGPLATFTGTIDFNEGAKHTVKLLLSFQDNRLVFGIRGQRWPGGDDFLSTERQFAPHEMEMADDLLQDSLHMVTGLGNLLGSETSWLIALPSYFEGLKDELAAAEHDRDEEEAANGPLPELEWGPMHELARVSLAGVDTP